MILFVMLCTLALIGLVEILSRREDLRRLHVEFAIDSTLTEPDEAVTLRYTVYNASRFPVLCAGLSLQLDPEIQLCEEEDWLRRHATCDYLGTRIDHHFYLLPYRKFSGRVRISFRERGYYELGRYYVERADFLGLMPVVQAGEMDIRVVCTARLCPLPELDTRGGFLGERSVRRFIQDDPSMLRGYREYTGREPMKQIAWLQSAKAGELIVRQNDYTIDQDVCLLVNFESTPLPELERCMKLTRSVCEELEARHISYGLYSNGDLFTVTEGLGRGHLFAIQRRIGLSRLGAFYGFGMLVEGYLRRQRENSSCIIITPRLTEAVAAALPRLRRVTGREPMILLGGEIDENRNSIPLQQ